jgi:hypothetical protein
MTWSQNTALQTCTSRSRAKKETLKIKSSSPKDREKRRFEEKNRKNLCLFETLSVLAQKKIQISNTFPSCVILRENFDNEEK